VSGNENDREIRRDPRALEAGDVVDRLEGELDNFVNIFRRIRPPSPRISIGNIDIYGDTVFLNGSAGGDHIVYVDFQKRYDLDRRMELAARKGSNEVVRELAENRNRVGILLADVSGHSVTDALVAAMLHQAFLTGVLYELDRSGGVTTRLLENLNTRFYASVSVEKYITMIYGEISRSGTFRFISAGHPKPLIFSSEFNSLVTICPERMIGFYPLGMFPSADDVDVSRNPGALRYKERYTVNEVNLMGPGDILLLYTDGLGELSRGDELYLPGRLEERLREIKGAPVDEIYRQVMDDALDWAPIEDDTTLVVIKRTA
jgi:serine phosphatase RsbU (regulator of sigma subunit)